MDSRGTALLGQPDDGIGDAPGLVLGLASHSSGHGEVSILVDNRNDVRQISMSFGRQEMTVAIFVVVKLDIVHRGLAQELVSLVHLDAEGLENVVSLSRLLDNGVFSLLLLVGCGRKHCEIMMEEILVGIEFHHLRVNEDKLQLRRVLRIEQ